MNTYIGIDVHSKTFTAVAVDTQGKVRNKGQFPTSETNILSFIKNVEGKKFVAVEETNLAQWIFLLLRNKVEDLAIAHPYHLKRQRGPKNDLVDAIRLADELRLGTITRVHHEAGPLWDLRVLVQGYLDVTQDLVRMKNRYKALLRTLRLPCSGKSVYTDSDLLATIAAPQERFVAVNLFEMIRSIQEVKDSMEERFAGTAKKIPVIKKLATIPGISTIRACVIAALVCSPERFATKHKFWAYSMLVHHMKESDGVVYGVTRVKGRTELKTVFMGAATTVLQSNNDLRREYDRQRSAGISHRDARKAVARRIAAIALMIMKTRRTYDDNWRQEGKELSARKTRSSRT